MATAIKSRAGIKLSVGDLRRAVSAVAPVVPSRSVQPVLTNVLIGDGMMVGTDSEVRVEFPLYGADELVMLPFGRLQSIVTNITGTDTVSFRIDGSRCAITAGSGQWVLPTENPEAFPQAGGTDGIPIARLPVDQFAAMLRSVEPATAKFDAMSGVQIEFVDGTLSVVATDGRRLAVAECDIDQATDNASALAPRKAIDAMLRLCVGGEDAIQLDTTGRELVATVGSAVVRGRLLDGQFPKWRKVEPAHKTKPTFVSAGELLRVCSMAAICASETSRGVTWSVGESGVTLRGQSAEFGESVAVCSVASAGLACSFTINPTYAIDWLRTVDPAETISIEAKDSASAVLFRAGDFRTTIMPLAKE